MKTGISGKKFIFVAAHLLLWLLIVFACEIALADFIPEAVAWKRAFFIVSLSAVVFYIHAVLLINRLLEKRRIALYVISVILLAIISIAARIFIDRHWTAIAMPARLLYMTPSRRGFLFLPTLLAVVVSAFYQLLLNRYNREHQYLVKISELNHAQLAFLKNQINPHFLFNNLNNIYSMIVSGSEGAADAVLRLSVLLRYVIYKSDAGKVSLQEECVQISNLIELFHLKDEGQHVSFDTSGRLANIWLEPMLLIPLVENCFKHSGDICAEGTYIFIAITADEEWITCTTKNTIFRQSVTSGEHGVGLANIRQRLAHTYGTGNYSLEAGSEADIFITNLKIRWKQSSPA